MTAPSLASTRQTCAIDILADLLERRTGQQIAPSRGWRLETALKPLLRELGVAGLDELVKTLVATNDGVLADRVVDALLNQETSFFRDAAVLDSVAGAAQALHAAAPDRRLRIWSTACSNGQEPLSLAILLNERGIAPAAVDIVATDVSSGAIARARNGRYSQFEIQRGLSVHRMMAWFEGVEAEWVAKPELLRRIHFRQHNLIDDVALAGRFDIVLCRNLLLYFSPELRHAAFDRLAASLRVSGLLVLGASETVIGQTERFVPSGEWRGLYRRV